MPTPEGHHPINAFDSNSQRAKQNPTERPSTCIPNRETKPRNQSSKSPPTTSTAPPTAPNRTLPPPHPTKTNNKNKTSESPGHPSQSPPTTHGGEPLLEAITEKEKPMLESVPDRLQLGHSWTTPSGTTKDQKESCLRQRYTADTHKPTDPQGRS